MKQHLEDETELRRYLLGELALKERVLIEEQLFLDDNYLLRVKAVEDDLIDDYVYDELTAGEREKFETHFLDKPGGRDDLRIAAALKRYISSETGAAETEAHDPAPGTFLSAANPSGVAPRPARGRESFFASLFGRRPVVGFSFAAAALIILSVIVWFAVDSATRQDRERPLQAQDSAPPQTTPVERQQNTSPVNSPVNAGDPDEAVETAERQDTKRGGTEEDDRRRAEQARQQAGRTRDLSPTPRQTRQTPTRVVAFLLLPGGSVRGGGASNNVEVSSDVGTVILRLPLAGRDEYDSYRATLQTGGRTTRTWAGLKPETDAEFGQVVPLQVPASLLRQQSYQIKLSGITATGQTRNLTSHTFQVERK
jgi:hypothetical protein